MWPVPLACELVEILNVYFGLVQISGTTGALAVASYLSGTWVGGRPGMEQAPCQVSNVCCRHFSSSGWGCCASEGQQRCDKVSETGTRRSPHLEEQVCAEEMSVVSGGNAGPRTHSEVPFV